MNKLPEIEKTDFKKALKNKLLNWKKSDKTISMNWTDLFADIMYSAPNYNSYRERISAFFEPTSDGLKISHNLQEDDYPDECNIIALNLSKFIAKHYKKFENKELFFKLILEGSSILRAFQMRRYNHSLYQKKISHLLANNDRINWPEGTKIRPNDDHNYLVTHVDQSHYSEIFNKATQKIHRGKKSLSEKTHFQNITIKTTHEINKNATKDMGDIKSILTSLSFKSKLAVSKELDLTLIVVGPGSLIYKKEYPDSYDPDIIMGRIFHCNPEHLEQIISLLSKLFELCLRPIRTLIEKYRKIAIFEWIFQQASPFGKGTPTIAKWIISAIFLSHGVNPVYSCKHNDMNCFLSFTSSLSEYLETWPQYTPYVNSNISLQKAKSCCNIL